MTSNPLYHVEVTITKLNIEGEYKGNCLFAGLTIYEGVREDLLFCSNRSFWNSNTRDTNHTLSPTDDMSLILYSIKNYTSVSASLVLTLSHCTGVMINPCEYEAYCGDTSPNWRICKHFNFFQSLHKIDLIIVKSLSLKVKTDSCVQLYASSFVKARKQNIFQELYHKYFLRGVCIFTITPDINSSKILIGNLALYASFVGKINRLETLRILGLGKIVFHQLEKYMPRKENDNSRRKVILIEEKDFNTKYKVILQYDIKLKIEILSGIGHNKGTKLNQITLGFQGGSDSTLLISLLVGHLGMLKENGLMSTLTSWEMFNIMSPDYILPLLNIGTIGKTKQLMNILTKINSGVYGYSLNIEITGSSFHTLINNSVLANLKIQT